MKRFALGVGIFVFGLFVAYQARGIYAGDSGDLVTAAYIGGVPHPPGYPLYTFLGWIVTHIPISTVAWRMGLLSSLPHAFVVVGVFVCVWHLTKQILPALCSVFVLIGNYLFFLYSVTPEVFALFDLLFIAIVLGVIMWIRTKRFTYLILISFLFGLSVAHHHIMALLLPALCYVFWKTRRALPKRALQYGALAMVFALGVSPYIYVPFAARGSAIINWDRAVDLTGLWRLITRSDYGTFLSSPTYGSYVVHRLLQIQAYGQFVLMDFSWAGIALSVLGIVWIWKKNTTLFWFFVLSLIFLGPGFFFYASFPLVNRFTLGTFERFLLPSYIVLTIVLGVGVSALVKYITVSSFITRVKKRIATAVLYGTIVLGIALGISGTLWRFTGMRNDMTAYRLAVDTLSSVPDNGVLLLVNDTTLFTVQYARYAQDVRDDLAVIHFSLITRPEYRIILANIFPDLARDELIQASDIASIVTVLRKSRPVTANAPLPIGEGWLWVPRGLVYELSPVSSPPPLEETIRFNDQLWQSFGHPDEGILSRYNHLMLSDIRDVYAANRIEYGDMLQRAGYTSDAIRVYTDAIAYAGDTYTTYAYESLGIAYLSDLHCQLALDAFTNARGTRPRKEDSTLTYHELSVYRDCLHDEENTRVYQKEYERLQKTQHVPLESNTTPR